jgi:hypothetical protein
MARFNNRQGGKGRRVLPWHAAASSDDTSAQTPWSLQVGMAGGGEVAAEDGEVDSIEWREIWSRRRGVGRGTWPRWGFEVGVSQVSRWRLRRRERSRRKGSIKLGSGRSRRPEWASTGFLVRIFGLQITRPTKQICPFSKNGWM